MCNTAYYIKLIPKNYDYEKRGKVMAKKIYEAECPYCGNDIEIDPYRNSKGYYTKPWKPQVGDIRQCPWCTWRYRVEGVHKTQADSLLKELEK